MLRRRWRILLVELLIGDLRAVVRKELVMHCLAQIKDNTKY